MSYPKRETVAAVRKPGVAAGEDDVVIMIATQRKMPALPEIHPIMSILSVPAPPYDVSLCYFNAWWV